MTDQEKNALWFWVRRQVMAELMDESEGEEYLLANGYYEEETP